MAGKSRRSRLISSAEQQAALQQVVAVAQGPAARGSKSGYPPAVSRGRNDFEYRPVAWNDPPERLQMGGEGFGDGRDGGVEGPIPSSQAAEDWRGRQSMGGASGLLETERSGLCRRGLEPAGAGRARPRTRRGSRFPSAFQSR